MSVGVKFFELYSIFNQWIEIKTPCVNVSLYTMEENQQNGLDQIDKMDPIAPKLFN